MDSKKITVSYDIYGRRILPPEIMETFRTFCSRGLQDSQANLRTNEALLGVIARGGDVAPVVSNPETYFDQGHRLPLGSEDDILRFTSSLPLHRVGTRPEQLLSVDSNHTRDFVNGIVSDVGETLAAKSKRSAGDGSTSSDGSTGNT